MSDERRKRSPNWLPFEKTLLLDTVEKHFHVIENKKTDGVSIKKKLAEWQIISLEYNSQTTHCHREAENLKSQWENMKKSAKKDASNSRMRRIQTGGGPPDNKKEDPFYSRILQLIKTSAVGLYNPYDNDGVAPVQAASEVESVNLPDSCNIEKKIIDPLLPVTVELMDTVQMGGSTSVQIEVRDWGNYSPNLVHIPVSAELATNVDVDEDMTACETQAEESATKDWGDYTPQLLKTPVSAQLKTVQSKTGITRRRPNHTPATTSLELLHKKKIEAINLQKILASEESERNKTISLLDIEIKKEILKQEKLKTRLLLLKLRKKRNEKNKENLKD